ncbi:MAG TPA: glycosyltransferase [Propionibacteriaceae bacterium]|nr:glycosyltransferase [Propionibacteriaceae bacterium]HQE30653.1 glycosyltransferase [Propionibacteriaceae bacterium]
MARGPSGSGAAVVTVTPFLQFDAVPHGGGRYLQRLEHALAASGLSQVWVAPDTPSNRHAALQPGCPPHHLVGSPPGASWPIKAVRRALAEVDGRGRRIDPGLPNLPLATGLRRDPVRSLLAGAPVIDLQWSEAIRLAGIVRRLAPNARLVGTFHDVQSQLFGREATRPGQTAAQAAAWRTQAAWARVWERRGVRRLDDVVVFSEKDADLLPVGTAPVHILRPPLAPKKAPTHTQPDEPVVVVVSYLAREENQDAAIWLLTDIWPLVRQRLPGARLRIIGGGAPAELVPLADAARAELAGFVDDLDAEYAAASVALVPLRTGAGVKFKTIEALVAGVPVVATPTGAEGVAGEDLLGTLPPTAAGVADRLVEVLSDPAAAQGKADRLQQWAMGEFGMHRFTTLVRGIYG